MEQQSDTDQSWVAPAGDAKGNKQGENFLFCEANVNYQ